MGISWTLYLLGLHEDIQERCRTELDNIFRHKDEYEFFDTENPNLASKLITTDITQEQINEMKYLDRVIKEAMRIFPPIPFVGRELTEDITIGKFLLSNQQMCLLEPKLNTNCIQTAGKYFVPKGATCVVFTHSLHSNPQIFPKPEIFDPDRFLPENAPKNIFSYIPFSAGPRNCIGQKFAQREQKVIIAKFLRNYYIKTVDFRDKLSIVGELVLRSRNGLQVRFSPRFKKSDI